LFATSPVSADSSSANYTLAEDRFTGGGGSASSANYQLAETSFEGFGNAAMTSANYALETKVGVSGAADIATINSVSPGNFAKFYSDSNASYTVSAVSQDGEALQYSAKQDSTTKVSAQSSNVLSWALSTSDQGRHTMGLSVIDPHGTTLKKQEAYIVRRPTK
jgi:uncharacterized protein YfaP (DUF2135 family)